MSELSDNFQIIKAVNFAAIKHSTQRRKDPDSTPYINHPLGVAYILTNEGLINDTDVLIGAILHDTVEDTDTSFEEITSEFSKDISNLVKEVTDDKGLSKNERKTAQVKNAPHKSHKAKLIKLADKIYNLRDLNRATPVDWTEQRVHDYFVWSKQVLDGVRGTNAHLEKIADELFIARHIM